MSRAMQAQCDRRSLWKMLSSMSHIYICRIAMCKNVVQLYIYLLVFIPFRCFSRIRKDISRLFNSTNSTTVIHCLLLFRKHCPRTGLPYMFSTNIVKLTTFFCNQSLIFFKKSQSPQFYRHKQVDMFS